MVWRYFSLLVICYWALACPQLATAGSSSNKEITLSSANEKQFHIISNALVCLEKSNQSTWIPGQIKKVKTKLHGKTVTKKIFMPSSLRTRTAISTISNKLSAKKRAAQKKKLTRRLQNEVTTCAGKQAESQVGFREGVLDTVTTGITIPGSSDYRYLVRWFPSDQATSYKLYRLAGDGSILSQSSITPRGCTHRAVEGFTSGLCTYSSTAPASNVGYSIRLTALNASGEGPFSGALLSTTGGPGGTQQAPTIVAVPNQLMSRDDSALSIPLPILDASSSTSNLSAGIVRLESFLYDLDQSNDLTNNGGLYSLNAMSMNEKWIRGQLGTKDWFYILPNGQVYRWRGSVSASKLLVTLPVDFYNDPTLFLDRVAPSTSAAPTISVNTNTIQIQNASHIKGEFIATITATNTFGVASQSFVISVQNSAPLLTRPQDIQMGFQDVEATTTLSASDPDGDGITLSAQTNISIDAALYTLDQANDLFQNNGTWSTNAFGLNEKWIRGNLGAKQWYYILPNGDLYRWGTSVATSKYLQTLPTTFYQDPTLRFDRQPPQTDHTPTVSWTGSTLRVQPNGYQGSFTITVRASDETDSTSQSFTVTVANRAPSWSLGTPKYVSGSQSSSTITLSASDPDGDVVTYSASVDLSYLGTLFTLDQDNDLSQNGGTYVLNAKGVNEKWFRGQRGARAWFFILPNGKVYRWQTSIAESIYVAQIPTAYYDDPSLLFDRVPPGPTPSVSVTGATLSVKPNGFVGPLVINVTASDGTQSASGQLVVYIDSPDSDITDPLDGDARSRAREYLGQVTGSVDALWDSADRMQTSLQLFNPNARDVRVDASVLINGSGSGGITTFLVPALGQKTISLSQFSGYQVNNRGVFHLDFADTLSGHVTYSRSALGGGTEYQYSIALEEAHTGTLSAPFVTSAPAEGNIAGSTEAINNILTLGNLESTTKTFVVYTYSSEGAKLDEREIIVAGYSRAEFQSSSLSLSSVDRGIFRVEPKDHTGKYFSRLVRINTPSTVNGTQRYSYALPIALRASSGRTLNVPVHQIAGAQTNLELANSTQQIVVAELQVRDAQGQNISGGNIKISIPASGHRSVSASSLLGSANFGLVTVDSDTPRSLVIESTSYTEDANALFTEIDSQPGAEALSQAIATHEFDFRQFTNNKLFLSNPNSSSKTIQVNMLGNTKRFTQTFTLAGNAAQAVDLNNQTLFSAPANENGILQVLTLDGAAFSSHLLTAE